MTISQADFDKVPHDTVDAIARIAFTTLPHMPEFAIQTEDFMRRIGLVVEALTPMPSEASKESR